jgi:S1-C subfamily serine protease
MFTRLARVLDKRAGPERKMPSTHRGSSLRSGRGIRAARSLGQVILVFAWLSSSSACGRGGADNHAEPDVRLTPKVLDPGPAPLARPDPPPVPLPPPALPLPSPLGPGAAIEDERNTISVFESVAPATVFVTQSQLVRNRFTLSVDQIPAGTGSGFVWDEQGHIVTNFHVVAGGDSFAVTLWDGASLPARLVGGDPKRDIAVLALDRASISERVMVPVMLAPAEVPLLVGQKALAIGNPFGLDHTLTTGVISALDREVVGFGGVSIRDMIQTDASINPGNSGGPLLDSAGRLIGMNTMIFSKSGSSAGIGFAVPVATIRRLVPQIIQYGAPRRAGLGIEILSDTIGRRAGLRGVIIEEVLPGGPAAKAGLRGLTRTRQQIGLGDVIVGIDDHEITNYDDLFNVLERYEPGSKVKVKVLRGGEVFAIETELALLEQ